MCTTVHMICGCLNQCMWNCEYRGVTIKFYGEFLTVRGVGAPYVAQESTVMTNCRVLSFIHSLAQSIRNKRHIWETTWKTHSQTFFAMHIPIWISWILHVGPRFQFSSLIKHLMSISKYKCTGMTQRDGMGREVGECWGGRKEGRFRMGQKIKK